MTQRDPAEHQHEYEGTYLRKVGDKWFVIFSGESATDRYVQMCDCGKIEGEDDAT